MKTFFCKENSVFSFQLLDFNSDFDAQSIEKPILFRSSSFLKNTAHILPNINHQLVKVKLGDTLVGHLYFQIMPFKGKELSAYIPQSQKCLLTKTIETLVDLALDNVNWNLLVLGNVFITGDNGQYWQATIDNDSKWSIIRQAAQKLAEHISLDAFLISDLRQEDLSSKEKIIDSGYRLFEVEPDLIFDINSRWQTFDDYLTDMISKYRVRTKKVIEKGKELSVTDLSLDQIQANEELLFALYKNVTNNADFKLAEVGLNYFTDFKKAYPSQFFIRAFYLNNEIKGMISYFLSNGTMHVNFVGLDYDFNKEHCIYQRILYDCIEQGILLKKKKIHFGRTASEIKTSVGAYPVKAFSLVKHNSTLPNLAIKPLTNYLKPEPFEIRRPFKAEKV